MKETIKLVISGSMGAGKTSAITAISGIPPVSTEALTFQEDSHHEEKTTTTVAMDYGELTLPDGRVLAIFGTPGQRRYDFICKILIQSALGLIILIDHTGEDPIDDLRYFLDIYDDVLDDTPCVVGITHTDSDADPSLTPYIEAMGDLAMIVPVCALDARSTEDITAVIECLMAILESNELSEVEAC